MVTEKRISRCLAIFNNDFKDERWEDVIIVALYYAKKWGVRLKVIKCRDRWIIKISNIQWKVVERYSAYVDTGRR